MTVHPLSIRRQLIYEHGDVDQVRFEFSGIGTVFRVRLQDGTSGHLRPELQKYLADHRAIATRVVLAQWEEGPLWPDFFDSLTDAHRLLAEACDSTKHGLEAAVVQAFDTLFQAHCETVRGGWISLTVQSKNGTCSTDELNAIQSFALACVATPGVRVDVAHGAVNPAPKPSVNLPFILNQASREGITDPILLAKSDVDEDLFRDARNRKFAVSTNDLLPHELRTARTVWLPLGAERALDISTFLPLYDSVYVPVEALLSRGPNPYGLSPTDLAELLRTNKLVPVIGKRLGDYDQKALRSIIDTGTHITPRRLTASAAHQMLSANPMWRIAGIDDALAKRMLTDLRTRVANEDSADARLQSIVNRWIDFQTDGCLHFNSTALNQSAFLPLHLGPGTFVAKVLTDLMGERAPDLEAQFIGLDVMTSAALNANCVPIPKEGLYPLYELLTLYTAARPKRSQEAALDGLPVIAQLDRIMSGLLTSRPEGMSVVEWLAIATPLVAELRNALEIAFRTQDTVSLETVQVRLQDLEKAILRLEKGNRKTAKVAERFEVVGVLSDVAAYAVGLEFPGAGTLISLIVKQAFPRAWDALSKNPTTQRARDVLEGANSFVPPNIVRLHRLRSMLKGATEKKNAD